MKILPAVFITTAAVLALSACDTGNSYTAESVMTEHPMGPYLNKESILIVKAFGRPQRCHYENSPVYQADVKQWGEDKVRPPKQQACDNELAVKTEVSNKAGMTFTDEDFLSPAYLEAYQRVDKENDQYRIGFGMDGEGIKKTLAYHEQQQKALADFKKSHGGEWTSSRENGGLMSLQ